MAPSQVLLALLLVIVVASYHIEGRPESQILASGELEQSLGKIAAIDCSGSCKLRCSKSSRPNLCKRACGTCCSTCKCVPPGTSGNYNVCPCYAAITTRGGARKCP